MNCLKRIKSKILDLISRKSKAARKKSRRLRLSWRLQSATLPFWPKMSAFASTPTMVYQALTSRISWEAWVERVSGRWFRTLMTRLRTLSASLPSVRDRVLSLWFSRGAAMAKLSNQGERTCLDGTQSSSLTAMNKLLLSSLQRRKTRLAIEATLSHLSSNSWRSREKHWLKDTLSDRIEKHPLILTIPRLLKYIWASYKIKDLQLTR